MRNLSKKRAAEYREYSKVKREYMEEKPYCEAMWMCPGLLATELHHISGKEGKKLTEKSNLMSVCRLCHERIHSHDAEAREKGFLKSRLSTQ